MKKLIVLFTITLVSGCAVVAEIAAEGALESQNNSQIKDGLQCNTMKVSCMNPSYYSEWYTPSGELMCQCEN